MFMYLPNNQPTGQDPSNDIHEQSVLILDYKRLCMAFLHPAKYIWQHICVVSLQHYKIINHSTCWNNMRLSVENLNVEAIYFTMAPSSGRLIIMQTPV